MFILDSSQSTTTKVVRMPALSLSIYDGCVYIREFTVRQVGCSYNSLHCPFMEDVFITEVLQSITKPVYKSAMSLLIYEGCVNARYFTVRL